MKCPKCGKSMKLIYTSKDGKAKFYQCKWHHSENRKVYMVE
jgi:ssDNA-binding Zn-finger/Zn-ribbon topoisomerase 1